jgi:hypothetical protein
MLRGEKSAVSAWPGGVKIGAGGSAVPVGKRGPVEGPNREAFPAGERFEPSIQG